MNAGAKSRPSFAFIAPGGRSSALTRRRHSIGWLALLPTLVLVLGILWLPLGQDVYYGFTDWNGVTAHWIGLVNYRSLFESPEFHQVLVNNAILLLVVPILVIGPLIMALVLSRAGRAKVIFRLLLFVPVPLSWAVIGAAGIYVFASGGPVNAVLRSIGLGALTTDWLAHESSAKIALLALITWAIFGINLLIYQSAVSALDDTLLDAAKVDGAGAIRSFFEIVIPTLASFLRFVTIYTVTLMYASIFTLIYVFSSGGPGYSTTTLEFFTYSQGFNAGQYSVAAAAGCLLFIAVFLVNLPQVTRYIAARGS